MTTNDINKLPPELYRAGRIDEVMVFPGLVPPSALELAGHVLETFGAAGKKVPHLRPEAGPGGSVQE